MFGDLNSLRPRSPSLVPAEWGEAGAVAEVERRKCVHVGHIAQIQSRQPESLYRGRPTDRKADLERVVSRAEPNLVQKIRPAGVVMRQYQVSIRFEMLFARKKSFHRGRIHILPTPASLILWFFAIVVIYADI